MCCLFAFIQTSRIISVEYRKALHGALALDLTRPYFRRGNAVRFNTQPSEILLNPHQTILHKGMHKTRIYTFNLYTFVYFSIRVSSFLICYMELYTTLAHFLSYLSIRRHGKAQYSTWLIFVSSLYAR